MIDTIKHPLLTTYIWQTRLYIYQEYLCLIFLLETNLYCVIFTITPSMVSAVTTKLDPYKSCRLDSNPAIVQKKCAPELDPVLYNQHLAA